MPSVLRPTALVILMLAATLVSASPAAAAASVSGRNLVTADEMAQGSTREGWRTIKARGQFDCGAWAVMKTGALDTARRSYTSDADASGVELAAAYKTRTKARKALARALSAVRTCFTAVGPVRVRADEELAGPGRIRLIQLYFPSRCCGSDTHTFGVLRRGDRTALVVLGEMGRGQLRTSIGTRVHGLAACCMASTESGLASIDVRAPRCGPRS